MNEINAIDNTQQTLPTELNHLFAQLAPQDVEQFYHSYRLWSLQRDIASLQTQIGELQQQIEHNAQLMQSVQPSPIALSALTQLQAYGVDDIDLLDRMLERGDSWLDHTVQLLVRCEELGVLRSDYTQWCENALEGAYDWIATMDQAIPAPATSEPCDENIEAALLQKLMSEDDTEPGLPIVKANATDITDQDTLLPANNTAYASAQAKEQASTDTTDRREVAAETPIPDHNKDQSIVPASTSSGTDLSCPPDPQNSQQRPHEHNQSLPAEPDIIAEPDSSYGTTEAINLDDLKVPITMQQEEGLATNPSNIVSDQSTDAINQVSVPSDLHTTTTETTSDTTIITQQEKPIYHTSASTDTTEDTTENQIMEPVYHTQGTSEANIEATTNQQPYHIYHIHSSSEDISYDRDTYKEASITIDNNTSETTSPIANHAEHTTLQENDSDKPTEILAAITTAKRAAAHTANDSETPPEQTGPITEHTTTQVHLQEDELALPPVTNTYKLSIPWSEPVVTTTAEQSEQTPQATTTSYKFSWSAKPVEPQQAPPKKRRSLLARLFHYLLN
jgi:hypothetical protein